ncbi:MAG: SRPBCC family protein [Saprospiraceae bacterium]|nr:SRPBCC family protein [Candidatus Vicinibacter proximus]MBL7824587.1 SRPBCC family protein [Saprospiraceae bacterium]MCC6844567.1 SRPBCC family protein [Saprospiraceae bacterium]HRG33899.1 SRPBCC family protein [Saprospiraceae bacterium]
MSIFTLRKTQKIPASLEDIWNFISSPKNLKTITPPYMGFDILTENLPEKVYPGMLIEYHVSPLLGIKMKWLTEITHIEEGKYFVDEQRSGPYKIWHHEHHLEAIPNGVLMSDLISYVPPFGFLGDIAQSLFIKNQLDGIFNFRYKKLIEMYGAFPE